MKHSARQPDVKTVEQFASRLAELMIPCEYDGELFLPAEARQKYCSYHAGKIPPVIRRKTCSFCGDRFMTYDRRRALCTMCREREGGIRKN